MKYDIVPSLRPSLPICGTDSVFPVSRIFGIGRNYSEKSEDEKKDEQKMMLFMKDPFMLSFANDDIEYPGNTTQLRYEIELVVAISKSGSCISPEDAESFIYGYAVGMDFTKYDVQDIAKIHGWPWDKGKSFRGCAPCTAIAPKYTCDINRNLIWLKKNGEMVQDGNLKQMIWRVPEIISSVSKYFELMAGDLIFTGTPKGVGMTNKGDLFKGGVEGVGSFNFKVK